MSKTIWKFPLLNMPYDVTMPEGSKILKVDMQGGVPTIWVGVDTDMPDEIRKFIIYGTGAVIRQEHTYASYIETVFDGPFVWHIFEITDCIQEDSDDQEAAAAV